MSSAFDDQIDSGRAGRTTGRLAVRLSESAKRILERAAEISGRTVSDFVVSNALSAARRTLDEHERMVVRGEDRDVFLAALLIPPEPGPKLRAAIGRYKSR